jgi:hypothetical protein
MAERTASAEKLVILAMAGAAAFWATAMPVTPANAQSAARSLAQQRPPIAEKMAKTFGLNSFGEVEGIRYTFNVEHPGGNVSRTWEWNPKTDTVSYDGKGEDGNPVNVTYKRSQPGMPEEIDASFLNDQYWLLLPFHVIWDTNATVIDEGIQKLRLGNESGEKLVVKYPSKGGYSPGDTWDVYVDADGRLQEFVYHRGEKPRTVIAPWTDYKRAGPLLFSLDHQGKDGDKPLHVFFSNVSVRMTGSESWVDAQ